MAQSLPQTLIEEAAASLYEAERTRQPIPPLIETCEGLTPDDAYKIQMINIARRIKEGAQVVGHKIGLTSVAMQQVLNVHEPDFGHLLNTMMVQEGEALKRDDFLLPRVEGEITFLLKQPIRGPGVTVAKVLSCTEYVMPSLEIIDSRVADWKIKLPDTIADNASSARMVIGGRCVQPSELDLRLCGMVLEKNGEIVNSAAGAAVLGNPASAVAWLANKLAEFDVTLEAGEVILPGALTAAVPVEAGDAVRATFDHLGSVSIRFV